MSVDDSDIAFAMDLFSALPDVTKRKMFGGMCLYSQGNIFALMSSDGQLYLKTSETLDLYGGPAEQFHNMPYYALPDAALDDPEAACALAQRALAALG